MTTTDTTTGALRAALDYAISAEQQAADHAQLAADASRAAEAWRRQVARIANRLRELLDLDPATGGVSAEDVDELMARLAEYVEAISLERDEAGNRAAEAERAAETAEVAADELRASSGRYCCVEDIYEDGECSHGEKRTRTRRRKQ